MAQPVERAIVILLTIYPGMGVNNTDAFKFYSPNSRVRMDPVTAPILGSDLIDLDSKSGDLDLCGLKVLAGHPDHESRHVDIAYCLDTPCPGYPQYSFYFTKKNPPLVPKGVDPVGQLKVHTFEDGATSMSVEYRNKFDKLNPACAFSINFTVAETGQVLRPGKCDPNVKNTPV